MQQLSKPAPMPVIVENIPVELRERDQWVCWSWVRGENKWDKPPKQPNGRPAKSNDPSTWRPFDPCQYHAVQRGSFDGVGYVLNDDFVGIDLDKCRDPKTGEISPHAERIVRLVASYTEVTPSGEGLRCIVRASLPKGRRANHKAGVEVYATKRFLTFTGHHLEGTPRTIEDRQEAIEQLHREYLTPQQPPSMNSTPDQERETALSALNGLDASRADHYEDWLGVGMALHSVDASLLSDWESWSQQSEKYVPGECAAKWASFSGGGIGIASLIHWAKQDGWTPPKRKRPKPTAATILGDDDDDPLSIMVKSSRSDIGNARRFIRTHGQHVRHCHQWNKWLVWTGKRWRLDLVGDVNRRAKIVCDDLWIEAAQAQSEEAASFAAKSAGEQRINAMVSLARSEPGIPILTESLDKNRFLLNCPDGTIDLRTGQLREHRQEDLITILCPTRFNPDATSYHFDRFLESIFDGNGELIDFVQRWFGHCLTGDVREQILPVFWGDGSNGKSTLLNAVMDAFGADYAMQADPHLLVGGKDKVSQHATYLASLFGKRFISTVETESGRSFNESFVKQLTGGERIRCRRMREDEWEFEPTHKVVLCTNHKPVVKGNDHAIWRRIALVPFNVQFWNPDKGETGPDELRQDKTLSDKLRAEREGILAWMVRGCLDWLEGGLRIPETVRLATSDYRSEQDILGRFVEECCITHDKNMREKVSKFYDVFTNWAEEIGEDVPSKRGVSQWLKRNGFEQDRDTQSRFYVGIGLKAFMTE